MRLDGFDLNLLLAFEVLLDERSVTRAARRLNVTQSAMSASLGRLRDSLGDPILVQHGKAMVPTPHALALAPEVSTMLAALRRLTQPNQGFDPATSARTFRIAASDYITAVLVAPLAQDLAKEAPSVRLELVLPTEETPLRLAKGEYDLVLTPEEFIDPAHPAEHLFDERHVIVGDAANPLLDGRLTPAEFAAAPQVAVRIGGRNTFIEDALERCGIARRVEIHAPSFTLIPWLLSGTGRLALMHERLALLMAKRFALKLADPPVNLPVMREMAQYHLARGDDAGLQWLRSRLQALAGAGQRRIQIRTRAVI